MFPVLSSGLDGDIKCISKKVIKVLSKYDIFDGTQAKTLYSLK